MRLIDCLEHWDALVARVPLGQWRDDETADVCSARNCAYCGGKECKHRDAGMVDDGVVFKKALSYHNSDPHAVVALKADIERQLRLLPRLPRALFRLLYQQGGYWEKGDRKGYDQRWVSHNKTLDEACRLLRIGSIREAGACHDLWLRRMERRLSDWFPASRGDVSAPLVPERDTLAEAAEAAA